MRCQKRINLRGKPLRIGVVSTFMRQEIVIRGTTKTGLVILLPDTPDFLEVCQKLWLRLKQTGEFFKGSEVTVQLAQPTMSEDHRQMVSAVLAEFDMILKRVVAAPDPVAEAQAALKEVEQSRRYSTLPAAALLQESETALVVTRTLRSGQSVRHQGDVIVLGDVNPGAEIIASGHIVVMGSLRGVAHAGCTGNAAAFVAATKLRPTQLRIAQVIGRAPDAQEDTAQALPEVARVREGMIVIETPTESKR